MLTQSTTTKKTCPYFLTLENNVGKTAAEKKNLSNPARLFFDKKEAMAHLPEEGETADESEKVC